LWELWIADELADGRLGVIGKAHHCMVDGIAAVELASLLLDPTPEPPHPDPDGWRPARAPDEATLLAGGIVDRVGEAIDLTLAPVRLLARPQRLLGAATGALRTARASVTSLRSATPETGLNEPISAARHLARSRRPMADFKRVKRQFGTTINDVVLTVAAGGVRRFLERRGETPVKLKAMVPVSVRPEDGAGALGNQISFVFVDLPCDEPDPLRRLTDIKQDIGERKRGGEPQGADALLKAFGYAPRTVQHVVSQAIASPRTFNLVVSNIPGLPQRMYMLGCELEEVYPVVPIADRHALSIGFTTFNGEAFFGVYADSESLPDADRLAEFLDESMDELLALG
jgi:WS/DGAT/MGAT family acyltransferase